jgi:hypothetical protein
LRPSSREQLLAVMRYSAAMGRPSHAGADPADVLRR